MSRAFQHSGERILADRRLRSAADELKARYDALEEEREAAADLCRPGPHPGVVEQARREWLAAEAAAEASRAPVVRGGSLY